VALTWTEDRKDPQYDISHDAYQRLRRARDARGRELTVHKIHQPGPLYMSAEEAAGIDARSGSHPRRAGDRLPASYINFYIANKCVVMPLYDKRWDGAAIRAIKRLFPSRKVIGVPTREVLLGGGNIHCITQQVPRAAAR
jgi:agmatine deiminase